MNAKVMSILVTTLFTMVFFQNCSDANEFSKNVASKVETTISDGNVNEADYAQQEMQIISYVQAKDCKRTTGNMLAPNATIYTIVGNDDLFPKNSDLINLTPIKRPGASYYSAEHVQGVDAFFITAGSNDSELKRDISSIKSNIEEAIGSICNVVITNYQVNSNDSLDLTKNLTEEELMILNNSNEISITE